MFFLREEEYITHYFWGLNKDSKFERYTRTNLIQFDQIIDTSADNDKPAQAASCK